MIHILSTIISYTSPSPAIINSTPIYFRWECASFHRDHFSLYNIFSNPTPQRHFFSFKRMLHNLFHPLIPLSRPNSPCTYVHHNHTPRPFKGIHPLFLLRIATDLHHNICGTHYSLTVWFVFEQTHPPSFLIRYSLFFFFWSHPYLHTFLVTKVYLGVVLVLFFSCWSMCYRLPPFLYSIYTTYQPIIDIYGFVGFP